MVRKHSKQRDLIKDFLMTRKDHPTADTVYMNVRNQNPNISLGTVYRNLTLLAEMGKIRRIRVSDGVDRYDGNVIPHYHFVCRECNQVLDLEMDPIDDIIHIAGSHFPGEIEGHVTYFYGVCEDCSTKL